LGIGGECFAAASSRREVASDLTAAGQVMGTPDYMAPEQREHPQSVDHRADIYSLGVVFYQMLTGELPTGRFAPPSKKVQIDVRLDEVVLRALEHEPDLRYQQVRDMKTRVETIVTTPVESCATGSASAASLADDAAIEEARRQVHGPAFGLLIVSIPNLVMLLILIAWRAPVEGHPNGMGVFQNPRVLLPILWAISTIVLIVAAFKMERLEAYRLAIVGSILASIMWPGNLIGLPIGIWALIVLYRPEVRAAFAQNRRRATAGRGGPLSILVFRRNSQRIINWQGVIVQGFVVMGMILVCMIVFGLLLMPERTRDNVPFFLMSSVALALSIILGAMYRAFKTPLDQLTPLEPDGPDSSPGAAAGLPSSASAETEHAARGTCTDRRKDWRSWVMMIGVRDGKKVINWHGVAVSWPIGFIIVYMIAALNSSSPKNLLRVDWLLMFPWISACYVAIFAWFQSLLSVAHLPLLDSPSATQHERAPGPASALGATAGLPSSAASPADDAAIEEARRQVKGPAIGLLVTGILNLLATPLIVSSVVVFFTRIDSIEMRVNEGIRPQASQNNFSILTALAIMLAIGLVPVILSSLMIFAGLKMKRLQAYGLGIAASVLAIVSPACFVGLPIGIWALVVLCQPTVAKAFEQVRSRRPAPPPITGFERLMGIAAILLCVAGLPLVGLVGSWFRMTWLPVFTSLLVVLLCCLLGRRYLAKKPWLLLAIPLGILLTIGIARLSYQDHFGGRASSGPESERITDCQYTNGPWTARFSNGVTVELVGVGENDNSRWWKPDGSSMIEPPCEIMGSCSGGNSPKIRAFYAKIGNRPSEPVDMIYKVVPSSVSYCFGSVKQQGKEVRNSVDFLMFLAQMPSVRSTVSVRYGIGTGPWQDIANKTYSRGGQSGASSGRSGGLAKPIETKDGVVVVASDHLTDEVRVIAIDDDGRELRAGLACDVQQAVSEQSPGSPPSAPTRLRINRATFAGLSLKKIKEIKLQSRPYEWVEFRNVALQPAPGVIAGSSSGVSPANSDVVMVISDAVSEKTRFIHRGEREATQEGLRREVIRQLTDKDIHFDDLQVLVGDRLDSAAVTIRGLYSPTNNKIGGDAGFQMRRTGSGLWLGDVLSIHFQVSTADIMGQAEFTAPSVPPATKTTAAAEPFGPVIEQTVTLNDTHGAGVFFLNIETGKLVKPPFAVPVSDAASYSYFSGLIPEKDKPPLKPWIAESGADLAVILRTNDWGVLGLGTVNLIGLGDEPRRLEAAKPVRLVDGWPYVEGRGTIHSDTPFGLVCTTFPNVHESANSPGGQCFWIHTRGGSVGVLELKGFDTATRGLKIRYKLVQGASTAPTAGSSSSASPAKAEPKASAKAATFGPVIERTVNDWRESPLDSTIDLDSGKLFSTPKDLLPKPGEAPASKKQAGEAWVRANGVDAGGRVSVGETPPTLPPGMPPHTTLIPVPQIGLGGLDMFATHTDTSSWDRITPVEMQSRLAQARLEYRGPPNAKGDMTTSGEFPATFLFETREGGMGVLQIVGFTEKPKAVKIRYKLMQKAKINQTTLESDVPTKSPDNAPSKSPPSSERRP
jgi:hypothetical protein